MKINALIVILSLFYLNLSAQVDRKAATRDLIKGFTDEFQNIENNKKYLSPNIILVWQDGGKWPDNSEEDFEDFWNNYSSRRDFFKSETSDIEIKESGNETYAFFTWKSIIRKNEKQPELVGTSAIGPIAYRMIWENDTIKEWHVFYDTKSREEQHQAQAKKN